MNRALLAATRTACPLIYSCHQSLLRPYRGVCRGLVGICREPDDYRCNFVSEAVLSVLVLRVMVMQHLGSSTVSIIAARNPAEGVMTYKSIITVESAVTNTLL